MKTKVLSSTERSQLWRTRHHDTFNAAQWRAKEAERIRKIRSKKVACKNGRGCKDESCNLHEDRDKKRKERILKKTKNRKEKGKLERKKNTDKKNRQVIRN